VQQADGQPVPGVAVLAQRYAFGATESPVEVGATDAQGKFDGYLEPGRVTLYAPVPGGEARSGEFDLHGGEEKNDLVLVADVGGQIVGSVWEADGQPALGAQVTAVETVTRREQGTGLVNGEGRFQFDGLPSGTYAVLARSGNRSAQAVGLHLEPGEVANAEIRFGSGTLSGRVLDASNQPVLGAQVSVTPEGAAGFGGARAESSADGSFHVEGLSGTRFAVEVTHVAGKAEAHGIASGTRDLLLRLTGQSEVRGYVTDSSGHAVTDFWVLADPVDVGPQPGQGGARAEGRFASATGDFHLKVKPGRYAVRVSAPGYTTVDAGQAEAPADGESSELRVVLASTRRVTALVVNAQNNQPIAGARVASNPNLLYAFGRANPVHFGGYAVTDGSGLATLNDVEPGNAHLFASADGYGWAPPVGVPAGQDPQAPVRLALPPGDTGNHDFSGVGMQITPDFHISSVFDSGPADLAGVRSGDLLVSVDGAPVQGRDLNTVINLIRGETGTPVVLGLSRDGQTFSVVPTRAAIKF
jgi:hypothetical protein